MFVQNERESIGRRRATFTFPQINVHNIEVDVQCVQLLLPNLPIYSNIAHVTLTLTTAKKRHINYQIHVA